jgi:hemoglobin
MHAVVRRLSFIIALALSIGCGKTIVVPKPPPEPSVQAARPLLERIGGIANLRLVVDDLMISMTTDERTKDFFVYADIDRLKLLMVAHLCVVAGGPCKYEGRSIGDAHAGLGVSEAQFASAAAALERALEKHGVGEVERAELMELVARDRSDLVSEPKTAR